MMRWFNSQSLSIKFLLLALPPSILVSFVFLLFVLLYQQSVLEDKNLSYAKNVTHRDAALLSRPLWNLEESSVGAILDTIKTESRLTCMELVDVLGFETYPSYGDCAPNDDVITLVQPIIYTDIQDNHSLGALKVSFNISPEPAELLRSSTILGGQTLLLLIVITISITLGYRSTILRPMNRVLDSIKILQRTGIRQTVNWDAGDELGQLIREYNSSLISQNEAEKRILKASQEFETTVQNLPFALGVVNSDMSVQLTNAAFKQLFSYPEWVSNKIQDWARFAFPDEMYREESLALMTIHVAHSNKTGLVTDPLVRDIMDAKGIVRTIELRYFLLESRGIFTFSDITAYKQAEQEISTLAQRFETTIRNLPFALAITNTENELEMVNSEFSRLFGYQEEETSLLSEWLTETRYSATTNSPETKTLKQKNSTFEQVIGPIETSFLRRDGEKIEVEARYLQLIDRGIWAITDITQRKLAESETKQAKEDAEHALNELKVTQHHLIQAEKLASLGSLVAGIAHEINTPVGIGVTVASSLADRQRKIAAAMSAGTLRKSDFEQFISEVDEATGLLNSSLTSAAHLIQDFKQVAADQTSSQRRTFELHGLVSEVLSTLSPKFKHLKHRIVTTIDETIVLDSYPGPLGQIITNLVSNAITHGFDDVAEGLIELSASADKLKETVILKVRDNGVGIDEMQLAHIFDPFYTTKMGDGGTGLGLNIVYNITNNILGGSINVKSTLGHNTEFILKLPMIAPLTNNQDNT